VPRRRAACPLWCSLAANRRNWTLPVKNFVVRARREQEVAGPHVGENYHSPKRGSITMSWLWQRLLVVCRGGGSRPRPSKGCRGGCSCPHPSKGCRGGAAHVPAHLRAADGVTHAPAKQKWQAGQPQGGQGVAGEGESRAPAGGAGNSNCQSIGPMATLAVTLKSMTQWSNSNCQSIGPMETVGALVKPSDVLV
jgi:hypothetical protein